MLRKIKEKKLQENFEDIELQKDKGISKEELKKGWKYLSSQGNIFKLFLAMVGYFIFLDILGACGVLNGLWVLILSIPIIIVIAIAYVVYVNKYGSDEMK